MASTEQRTVRFATVSEIAHWNELLAKNPGGAEIWHTREYAEQKAKWHYTPHYLVIEGPHPLAVTVHEKTVPLSGKLWYLPKGPAVDSLEQLAEVTQLIAEFGRSRGVFVVKVEPPLTYVPPTEVPGDATPADFSHLVHAREKTDRWLTERGFVPSVAIIPNSSTVVVDISGPVDDVFARIPNKKLRGIIRKCERDGVVVKQVDATDANCEIFYALLAGTADGRFGIRPKNYYLEFWKRFADSGQGQMMFAFVGDQIVAAEYAVISGTTCTSKDAGSLRQLPIYGATQLLRWKTIEWAKSRGCTRYDMCGSPSSDHINDETDPFYGIGRFKIAFSRTVLDYLGVWDYPVEPRKYRWFVAFTERAARRLSLIVRKDPYY